MQNRLQHLKYFARAAAAAAILFLAPLASGQVGEFDPPRGEIEESAPERKTSRFWRRPGADTPTAQLALAEALESAGRIAAAGRAFDALVRAWPDTPESVTAQRRYAQTLEQRGRYEQAFEEYQYLIDYYAGRFDYHAVIESQFRLARAVMERRRARWLFGGFTSPSRALPLLEQLAANAPAGPRAAEILFTIGVLREQDRDYEEAIRIYGQVRQRWPAGPFAAPASFARARCLTVMARRNPRDEEGMAHALTALSGFLLDYPDDPNVAAAEKDRDALTRRLADMHFERAAYYDRIARRPQAALIAYQDFLRRFPLSEHAPHVSRRIEEIEALDRDSPEAAPAEEGVSAEPARAGRLLSGEEHE